MKPVEIPDYTIRKRVEFDPSRTALLVMDMQNDFVREEGALCVPEAASTVPVIGHLVEAFRIRGLTIVYTQDSHGEGDPEFEIWGRHVLAGTAGEEIIDELKPRENDVIVKKPRYDAFFETDLDDHLRNRGIDTLIIVGTVANICVHYTTASAAQRWYRVICPVDGISSLTEFDRHVHFHQTENLFKGILTTSKAVIEHLEGTERIEPHHGS